MTVHYRLRELLAERGISLRELSRRTLISTSVLTAINTNKTVRIDNKTVDRICAALDCTPGDLIVREAPAGPLP